jgi:uncharacterized protein YdhG (YjbR/CyaY superfamily)
MSSSKTARDIDEYISMFPINVQKILKRFRQTIRDAAPDAEEAISYQIPTFKLNGNLVHFAAFKDHISFFPTSSGRAVFRKELSKYKGGKGTIQFSLDEPIPYELVRKITKYRVKESLKDSSSRGRRK